MSSSEEMYLQNIRASKMMKKSWSSAEDAQLVSLVEMHGATNWTTISSHLNDRTGKQCRERYHNHLQPNIKKGDWTDAEDSLIAQLHETLGNQWAEITKALPGRTNNAVKNRWYTAHRAQLHQEALAAKSKAQEPSILPVELKQSQIMVPRLCLTPSTPIHKSDFTLAKMSSSSLESISDLHMYHHSRHDHILTLSSRSDFSDAPLSSRTFEGSIPSCSVSAIKASPRIEIVAEEILKCGATHCKSSDAFQLDELCGWAVESGLDDAMKAAALELDLDFLSESSPSSYFESRDDPDLTTDDDDDDDSLSLGSLEDLAAVWAEEGDHFESAEMCFFAAMQNMEISPRNTPRSPMCPVASKKRRV